MSFGQHCERNRKKIHGDSTTLWLANALQRLVSNFALTLKTGGSPRGKTIPFFCDDGEHSRPAPALAGSGTGIALVRFHPTSSG